MVLWIVVAAVCSLLIVSGGRDNGSVAQAESYIGPFAGEYGGYTQYEGGAGQLDYTGIHRRILNTDGSTTGKTYATIYPTPSGGVSTVTCTSTGTASAFDGNFIEIKEKQKCDNTEYELDITVRCVGVSKTSKGYTELYCQDWTDEFPGYEAINLTILKRTRSD